MSDDLEALLRPVFREEASELLSELRGTVSALYGADANLEKSVPAAMRLAHNLKGAAAQVGYAAIERAAHTLEDAFLRLRELDYPEREQPLPMFSALLSALELAAEGTDDALVSAHEATLTSWLSAAGAAPGAAGADETHLSPQPSSLPEARATAKSDRAESCPGVERADDAGPTLPAGEGRRASQGPDASPAMEPSSAKVRTVRIATERLDRLLELASELLVAGTGMRRRHEQLRDLREDIAAGSVESALRVLDTLMADNQRAVSAFDRLSGELHESMRRARMVRIEALVPALRRTLDDAARGVNKHIDLETEFSDVEIDKVVLDHLRDPLMHLLRNAVDHGIETAEVRELRGKPQRALVYVGARVAGNCVAIEVADDGCGIEPRAIAAAAVQRGLVDAAQAAGLDEAALVDLMFSEGFSTREHATRLSGRGVGLDVVRRSLNELGGSVRAQTRGRLGGAAFLLTVPLSLLTTRLLLVRLDDTVYAVAAHAVVRVAKLPRQALNTLEGSPIARLSETESLPVRALSQLLLGQGAPEVEHVKLLVLSHAGHRLAITVDDVLHEEELLVRKLPWNLLAVPGISGAAVRADGSVAVVVDPGYLVSRLHLKEGARAATPEPPKVLVVDDSMTTRTLHRGALQAAGYSVMLAHDGSEAWELLRKHRVDAVVSDVQMPGLDGFELTRRVRADARLKRLPVVLVTTLDSTADRQRGMDAGADAYVIKGPHERDALLAAVNKHLHAS